jgi:hypothetical protein
MVEIPRDKYDYTVDGEYVGEKWENSSLYPGPVTALNLHFRERRRLIKGAMRPYRKVSRVAERIYPKHVQ